MTDERRVVVVGAGAAGLFAARRLLSVGLSVTLVERAPQAGGLLAWTRVGATDLELFYHHLFRDDRLTLATLRELEVPVDWRVTRTGFLDPAGDGIAEFSGPQHVFSYPHLRPFERAQLAAALARIAFEWIRQRDAAALDEVPARAWLTAQGLGHIYDRFFEPLVVKKFGRDTPDISAAWLIGRLGMRAGRSRRGEWLGYPRGGFRSLVTALLMDVRARGGDVRLATEVHEIAVRDGRVRGVRLAPVGGAPGTGELLTAGAVLLTPEPAAQVPLLERSGLSSEAARLQRLPYQGTLTVLLGFERPLSEFYWLNVTDRAAPFGAVIEHTRFQPPALYEGPTVYLAAYPDPGDPLWTADEGAVVEQFVSHLRRLLPGARGNGIRWSRVVRTGAASLVYRCGVAALLPPPRAPVPGLYYSGMFRAYPKRPVELIARDACACAELMAEDLGVS